MERLTRKKLGSSYPLKNTASAKIGLFTDYDGFYAFFEAVNRLGEIEDILGEEYDLEQLRQLVQTTQTGRCKRCRYSRQPSRQTQLYGEPGTLTCHHGPCNRRNVNENDYCSYFAPKEESAP